MEKNTARGGSGHDDSAKLPLKKRPWLRTLPTPQDDHVEDTSATSASNNRNVSSLTSEEVPIDNMELDIIHQDQNKRSHSAAFSKSKNDHNEIDRKGKKTMIIDDDSTSIATNIIPPLNKKGKKALVMSSITTKAPPLNRNSCDQASTSSSLPSSSSSSSSPPSRFSTDNEVSRLLHDIMRLKKYENVTDKKLIIRKRVEKSDTLARQSRISIPKGLILAEFLTEAEKELLKQKDEKGKCKSINVTVIGGLTLEEYEFKLSRWDYEDRSGYRYALKSPQLSQFRFKNELNIRDLIRVVSFRSNGRLYFLIVKFLLNWGTRRRRT